MTAPIQENPLYPLFYPHTVDQGKLVETGKSVYEALNRLSVLTTENKLYEATRQAIRVWRGMTKGLTPKTALQVHSICNQLLMGAEKFKPAPEHDRVTVLLSDGTAYHLTHCQFETLEASQTIEKALCGNWKEKNCNQLKLNSPYVSRPIFEYLINLLSNSELRIPESTSLLDLAIAAEHLHIPALVRFFLDKIQKAVSVHTCSIEELLLVQDCLFIHFPHESEILNRCFDTLHLHYYLQDYIPDISRLEFASDTLKTLKPLFIELHENRFNKFLSFADIQKKSTDAWVIAFYLMMCLPEDILEKNSLDYRGLMLQTQVLMRMNVDASMQTALDTISNVLQLRPSHLFAAGLRGVISNGLFLLPDAIKDLEDQKKKTPRVLHFDLVLARARYKTAVEKPSEAYLLTAQTQDIIQYESKCSEVWLLQAEGYWMHRGRFSCVHSCQMVIESADQYMMLETSAPSQFPARILKTLALFNLNRLEEAFTCIEEAIAQTTNDRMRQELYPYKVKLLIETNQLAAASFLLIQCVKDKKYLELKIMLALKQRDFQDAERLINSYAEKYPDPLSELKNVWLSYMYALKGDGKLFWEERHNSKTGSVQYEFFLLRAQFYFSTGQYEDALDSLWKEKEDDIFKMRIPYHELLAQCYLRTDQGENDVLASMEVKKILAIWPKYELSEEYKELLERCK